MQKVRYDEPGLRHLSKPADNLSEERRGSAADSKIVQESSYGEVFSR